MTDSDDKLSMSSANGGRKAGGVMDVRGIVDAVVAAVEPLARKKGLNVAIRCAPDLPERVMGDSRRIEQVLLELAQTAVAATDRGFVAISARPVAEAGALGIELLVRDTSSGPRTPGTPGELLARALSGRLEIETGPDAGTTVRFVFPAPVADQDGDETATEWGGLPGRA